MPQNVYTSNINGKTELFTDKSPLPEIDILVQPSSPGEEVLEF
jgi:penicillin-binding protein 1A